MSSTTPDHAGPGHAGPGPAALAPFGGLVAELGELGFEPQPRPAEPGRVVYAATDSPATVTLVTDPDIPYVRADSATDSRSWHLDWTAGTPVHVQLIALYAVVNDDPTAALVAVAAALGTTPPAEPARPSPAG